MTTLTVTSGPRNATTDAATGLRSYTWLGRKLPSVTSLRRIAGLSYGLHQWSIGKVVDAALGRAPEIAARLAGADPGQVALIRHELRAAATADRDAAGKLGTAVHEAAAAGKTPDQVAAEIRPRLAQYRAWLEASGAEILGAEFQIFNLSLGYAGSADLLVRLRDGSIWLVDLKTGKSLYGEHALQLMAYLMAEFVGADDVVDEPLSALLAQASGMAVLHLADDHWEFRSVTADAETWSAFRGLLSFATWLSAHDDIGAITAASRRGAA